MAQVMCTLCRIRFVTLCVIYRRALVVSIGVVIAANLLAAAATNASPDATPDSSLCPVLTPVRTRNCSASVNSSCYSYCTADQSVGHAVNVSYYEENLTQFSDFIGQYNSSIPDRQLPGKPVDLNVSYFYFNRLVNDSCKSVGLDVTWRPPQQGAEWLTGFLLVFTHTVIDRELNSSVLLKLNSQLKPSQNVLFRYNGFWAKQFADYRVQVHSLPRSLNDSNSETFYIAASRAHGCVFRSVCWNSMITVDVLQHQKLIFVQFAVAPAEFNFRQYIVTLHLLNKSNTIQTLKVHHQQGDNGSLSATFTNVAAGHYIVKVRANSTCHKGSEGWQVCPNSLHSNIIMPADNSSIQLVSSNKPLATGFLIHNCENVDLNSLQASTTVRRQPSTQQPPSSLLYTGYSSSTITSRLAGVVSNESSGSLLPRRPESVLGQHSVLSQQLQSFLLIATFVPVLGFVVLFFWKLNLTSRLKNAICSSLKKERKASASLECSRRRHILLLDSNPLTSRLHGSLLDHLSLLLEMRCHCDVVRFNDDVIRREMTSRESIRRTVTSFAAVVVVHTAAGSCHFNDWLNRKSDEPLDMFCEALNSLLMTSSAVSVYHLVFVPDSAASQRIDTDVIRPLGEHIRPIDCVYELLRDTERLLFHIERRFQDLEKLSPSPAHDSTSAPSLLDQPGLDCFELSIVQDMKRELEAAGETRNDVTQQQQQQLSDSAFGSMSLSTPPANNVTTTVTLAGMSFPPEITLSCAGKNPESPDPLLQQSIVMATCFIPPSDDETMSMNTSTIFSKFGHFNYDYDHDN